MIDMKSQTPTIFNEFLLKLMRNIFLDEMGEELFNEYIFVANVPYRKVSELLNEKNSEWWDDILTDSVENRDEIIRQSLVETLESLEGKLGKDIAFWQWMELHTVTFKHMFSNSSPMLANLLNIGPFPIGGDATTIFNTEYSFTKPDELNFILPTGQSGYFMSEHYSDMTKSWINGKYLKVNINTSDIANRNYELLRLLKE
jgi:penicillin amidase